MVCVVVFLGDRSGESHTAESISIVTKVPVGYLAKILQGLSKAGLVKSQRGPHGGFTLTQEPKEITVYEVVQAIDPFCRLRHAH